MPSSKYLKSHEIFTIYVGKLNADRFGSALSFLSTVPDLPHTFTHIYTQYMLVTHSDDLLCLQLHTVVSPHTHYMLLTHADD